MKSGDSLLGAGSGGPPSPVTVLAALGMLAIAGTIALTAPDAEQLEAISAAVDAGGTEAVTRNGATLGAIASDSFRPRKCRARRDGQAVFSGPADEKQVALTFDDGPAAATPGFLDVLAAKDIEATFYVLGTYIPGNEATLRRMVDEGHSVGNHTTNHVIVAEGGKLAREEILPTSALIAAVTGVPPCTFRPPFGAFSPTLEKFVTGHDMDLIRWDIDTEDALGSGGDETVDAVKRSLHPGAIILLHDGGAHGLATLSVLPRIISLIRREGYGFVTVPEMLGLDTDEPADEPQVTVAPIPGTDPKPELGTDPPGGAGESRR